MRTIEVIRRGRKGDDGLSNIVGVQELSGDFTAANANSGQAFHCTANLVLTLPAILAEGWSAIVDADGGDVTISTAATINGASSLVVTDGNSAFVYSDGTAHYARFYVANALTILAASGVGFSPITGNSATDVQAAIANVQGNWNGISAYILTLLDDVDAATARTTLGLGTAAVSNVLDEDDFASDSDTDPPSQQSAAAYIDTRVKLQAAAGQDATSGPTVEFTALPAGISEINVMLTAIQLTGSDDLLIEIGGASGWKISGYESYGVIVGGTGLASTAGMMVRIASTANVLSGTVRLIRMENNLWIADHVARLKSGGDFLVHGSGTVDLAEELTQLRIGRSGTNNFTGSGRVVVNWR